MKTLKYGDIRIDYITEPDEAAKFVRWLAKHLHDAPRAKWPGLDLETTALSPDEGHVRLVQIAISSTHVYVVDLFKAKLPFGELAEVFEKSCPLYVFNVNFEGRWCDSTGRVTDLLRLYDVGHMRRSVQGGGPLKLATMAKWDLDITLEKELQLSDWSQPQLTDDQIIYAGQDAAITKELGDLWAGKMNEGHWNGFHCINDAWRAVNECYDTGMVLDVAYHRTLIAMWEKRRQAAEVSFRKYVPESVVKNIRSKLQLSNMLRMILDDNSLEQWPKTEKTGQLQTDRKILREASYNAPYPLSRALAALMVFNRADKYLSTYGETLITKTTLSADAKIRGRLNMAAAITGRFSSSGPNLQNIPRSPVVRRSFIAPKGKKAILADYSGIEIRVLAEMSDDKILLHDAIYDDVHSRSAIAIFKENADAFLARIKAKSPEAKEKRSKAKGFTFQLTYGAGVSALALVLRTTSALAQAAVEAWASRYQKAYQLRFYMQEKMNHDGYLPCASGRTIFVPKRDRSLPVASNYPIQGSAGDVMYRAMYWVRRLLIERAIDAWLMVSVHDELLLIADDVGDNCERAAAALEDGMKQGWLDIFPGTSTENLIDAVIGDSWADKA